MSELEERCSADGRACVEPVARTDAAMRLIYAEGDRECGEQMLAQARDWARLHGYDVEHHGHSPERSDGEQPS